MEVGGATVRYRVRGAAPTVVFVHGVYVGGSLWHGVVGRWSTPDGSKPISPTPER